MAVGDGLGGQKDEPSPRRHRMTGTPPSLSGYRGGAETGPAMVGGSAAATCTNTMPVSHEYRFTVVSLISNVSATFFSVYPCSRSFLIPLIVPILRAGFLISAG